MFTELINGIIAAVGGVISFVFIVGVVIFLAKQKSQDSSIPPLDLIDAKKLDAMVSQQAEEALKPLLQAKGYTEDQIKTILTRTSLGYPAMRRS